jgi:hypothetical protein
LKFVNGRLRRAGMLPVLLPSRKPSALLLSIGQSFLVFLTITLAHRHRSAVEQRNLWTSEYGAQVSERRDYRVRCSLPFRNSTCSLFILCSVMGVTGAGKSTVSSLPTNDFQSLSDPHSSSKLPAARTARALTIGCDLTQHLFDPSKLPVPTAASLLS